MGRDSIFLGRFLGRLSKPKRKFFSIYLAGLIWMIKFRSIREIAVQFGQGNIDGLHNFLTHSAEQARTLQEENQDWIAEEFKDEPGLTLIIDDTPDPREGKGIEGLGIHHSADGLVKGLCAVTAIAKAGLRRFGFAIRGYRPEKTCSLEVPFKSKVELALEILQEAQRCFKQSLTVLMDSWYTCAPLLHAIGQAKWIFLGAIKRNRILKRNGRKTSVEHLVKGSRRYVTIRKKKKKYRVAKVEVYLPKVGDVLLFISKSKDGTRFFVTNDLTMTEKDMVRLYGERFWIETFHQEMKQHLGFGETFMRSWSGVQTHWTLVGIAYNLIQLSASGKSKSFRQKIRTFRTSCAPESMIKAGQPRGFRAFTLKRAA